MQAVAALPPIAALRLVLARYDAAGGGLMAAGLAYSALFAIVPGVLLATGLIGFAVSDAAARADAVEFIAAVLPPLHDIVATALAEAGRDAGAFGLIGAATLAWGASRFVVAFSDAVARMAGRGRRRGALARNFGAIVAVLLLPLVIVAGATLAGLLSFLGLAESQGVVALLGDAVQVVLGFVPVLATTLVMGLVYRVVPTPMPSWRAVVPPAIVVGIAQAVLLQLFVYLAPRLIGVAALLGTIAVVFAALAWLSLAFQAILLGAAWVGERDSRPSGA